MAATLSDAMAPAAEREIVSTRLINAPRAIVFQAFSNPTVLALWWGPQEFLNIFQEFDLRPGGMWRFVMRGPDGSEYPMEKRFLEVVPAERIVLLHIDPIHEFRMTMIFTEAGQQTRLTWRMLFTFEDEFARVKDVIRVANEQNFDRLEAHLATMA